MDESAAAHDCGAGFLASDLDWYLFTCELFVLLQTGVTSFGLSFLDLEK